MMDLGTLAADDNSEAFSINSRDAIVGSSWSSSAGNASGVLWENNGRIVDLNTLVLPGTTMTVTEGLVINDRREIGCLGVDPGDTVEHACLLIPCDENHTDVEGCQEGTEKVSAVPQVRDVLSWTQRRSPPSLTNRFHFPGHATGPRN
jgi:hypothetical protein